MKNKIKKFLNRKNVKFGEENDENYVTILEENKETIKFYCSSFWATIKLCEILLSCNYSLKVDCKNDENIVLVEKETEKRINKLIENDLIDNEYFVADIFM